MLSPTFNNLRSFDTFSTHSTIHYNDIHHDSIPVIQSNHSFIRTNSMPIVSSIDQNDSYIHDHARSPPPRYEDAIKFNNLPNYSNSIKVQKI